MSQSTGKTLLLLILIIIGITLIFPISSYFFLGRTSGQMPFLPWVFPTTFIPLILLLIIWILVVVWVYRDAAQRNMNGVLWALLVFFGNFVGLLIYLIVRSEELPNRIIGGVSEPCPSCGKAVPQSYSFCPHCGVRLKAVCPSCNKSVFSDWKVCPYCGQKLADEK